MGVASYEECEGGDECDEWSSEGEELEEEEEGGVLSHDLQLPLLVLPLYSLLGPQHQSKVSTHSGNRVAMVRRDDPSLYVELVLLGSVFRSHLITYFLYVYLSIKPWSNFGLLQLQIYIGGRTLPLPVGIC